MRYSEFQPVRESDRLDEIGPLISIANWFSQKYQDVMAAGAQKLGQGEVQRFTNQHLRSFMQFMGRYKLDWPTLKLYVVYQYLRLVMKLQDDDIMEVVNEVMTDPKVRGKRMTSIQQIQDKQKTTMLSSLSKSGGDPTKMGQIIAEMILAAGAIRQMERHWERQSKSGRMEPDNPRSAPRAARSTTASQAPVAAKPATPATPAASTAIPHKTTSMSTLLTQLGVANP